MNWNGATGNEREVAMDGRLTRRMMGVLSARLPEAKLERVEDPRREASVTWPLATILKAVVAGTLTCRKSLSELENLTAEMSPSACRLLDLPGRLPDTTARDVLVQLKPSVLRPALYQQIRTAQRRKALAPVGLPFGVVSLDGKFTAVKDTSGKHAPVCEDEHKSYGKVGTVTSTLISAAAKPCLDAHPIGAGWGESSVYPHALGALIEAYGSLDLFKLVFYDAGGCSRVNARETLEQGLDYCFRLKEGNQPKLYHAAQQVLAGRSLDEADAVVMGRFVGSPERRSVYLTKEVAVWPSWTELKTIVRVHWEKLNTEGQVVKSQERYYVSSLDKNALDGEQWVTVTRGHWAVENNCHHTFDAVLREDERPWITEDAQGTLVVMMLRRIAYNILTLFRAVSQRSAQKRLVRWRDLCRWFYNALLVVTPQQLSGLRPRQGTAITRV